MPEVRERTGPPWGAKQRSWPLAASFQSLDMPAEARRARWSPVNGDACIVTSALERAAAEIGAVVDVNLVRETRDGPRLHNVALFEPGRLVED